MHTHCELFKQGAIKEWKKLVLDNSRMNVALKDINKFISNGHCILPKAKDVFNMFRMIYPSNVKVVIVGQSPYPGYCPVTNVPYAFGAAFLPSPGCVTTPMTLRNVILEVYRDICGGQYVNTRPPRDIITSWINQGVMLLNSSFTVGKNCPKYLEDHSVLWEEVTRKILSTISCSLDPVFVLVGKEAWKFEDCIASSSVIKVSHPVARKDTSTPWAGSSVFSRVSTILAEKEIDPVYWL